MKEQNFKNHSKYVPLFHGVLALLIVLGITGAMVHFVQAYHMANVRLVAALMVILFVISGLFFWFIRSFSLGAQDRAIRAEENLRYFSITGKLLDSRLTLGQVIALRFAPNDELVALSERTIKENLKPADIKQAIRDWKADHNRI